MEAKHEKPQQHNEKSIGMEINLKRYFCRFWCTSKVDNDTALTLKEPLIKSPQSR